MNIEADDIERTYPFSTFSETTKQECSEMVIYLLESQKKEFGERINDILQGIDKTQEESLFGWWEASSDAEFGKHKLDLLLQELNK